MYARLTSGRIDNTRKLALYGRIYQRLHPNTSEVLRSMCGRPKGSAAPIPVRHRSCCRAIKTHATKRSIAFSCTKARPFERLYFIAGGCALDRGQRMLELWNNWYDTLASAEALATVIVIVLVAAGAITLAESRRR